MQAATRSAAGNTRSSRRGRQPQRKQPYNINRLVEKHTYTLHTPTNPKSATRARYRHVHTAILWRQEPERLLSAVVRHSFPRRIYDYDFLGFVVLGSCGRIMARAVTQHRETQTQTQTQTTTEIAEIAGSRHRYAR